MRYKGDPAPLDRKALGAELRRDTIQSRDDCRRSAAKATERGEGREAQEYRALQAKAQKLIDDYGFEDQQ